MALVATAGASDADSFALLADTDSYFLSLGITAWAGTDAVKENALRRGTQYLENQYRNRWIGIRTNETQSLSWPRIDGSRDPYHATMLEPLLDLDGFQIPTDTVPLQIQRATMEAALLVLGGSTLEPVLTRGGRVKSQSDTVGPISSTTVYEDGSSPVDRYTVIEGFLRGLVRSFPGASAGNVSIVRA